MRKSWIGGHFWLIGILITVGILSLDTSVQAVEVEVKADRVLGAVPDVFSSSVWIVKANNRYQIERFLAENHPKAIQLTLDLFLPKTKSFSDYKTKLKDEYFVSSGVARLVVESAKEKGAYLIVGFDPFSMPSWLSSRQGDRRSALTHEKWWTIEQMSPTSNYKLWGETVSFLLTFLSEELGVKKLGFYVGHEPNWLWMGNEESLFKYYEAAARAAKKVSPEILVGGLGPWNLEAKKEGADFDGITQEIIELATRERDWKNPDDKPLLKSFIEYVSKFNVPLDFLNWHSFLHDSRVLVSDAKKASEWLRESHLDDVKLYISDWTYWAGWPYPDDYLDTEETAAQAIQALFHMWKGGVWGHGHDFDIQVDVHEVRRRSERNNAEFVGDWPLFTKHGIIKPIYNAFKALSLVTKPLGDSSSPTLLETNSSSDDLISIASMRNDGVYLLLSNHSPLQARLRGLLKKIIVTESNFSKEELAWLKNCLKENKLSKKEHPLLSCKEQFLARTTEPQKIELVEFLAKVYPLVKTSPNLKNLISHIREAANNLKHDKNKKIASLVSNTLKENFELKSVNINFTNLPFSPSSEAQVFSIDRRHSNACKLNKDSESAPSQALCGIDGRVDRAVWQAKADANEHAKEKLKGFLAKKGYSEEKIHNALRQVELALKKGEATKVIEALSKRGFRKKDITSGIEKLKAIRQERLAEEIDAINSWQEISLEGSKALVPLGTAKTGTAINVAMEPNSVKLIVIKKN